MNGNEFFGSTIRQEEEGGGGTQDVVICKPLEQECKTYFHDVNAVPKEVWADVLSITVPTDEVWYLQRVAVGGNNAATYELWADSLIVDRVRRWYGAELSGVMEFTGFPGAGKKLSPGTVLKVKVYHTRPFVGDFEARVQWFPVTITPS